MAFGGQGTGFLAVKLLRACAHAAVFGVRSLYVGMAATDAGQGLPHAPYATTKPGDNRGGSAGGGALAAQQVLLQVLLGDLVPLCAAVLAAARSNAAVRTSPAADRRPCALADGAARVLLACPLP
jgi:hypothetical protein